MKPVLMSDSFQAITPDERASLLAVCYRFLLFKRTQKQDSALLQNEAISHLSSYAGEAEDALPAGEIFQHDRSR